MCPGPLHNEAVARWLCQDLEASVSSSLGSWKILPPALSHRGPMTLLRADWLVGHFQLLEPALRSLTLKFLTCDPAGRTHF